MFLYEQQLESWWDLAEEFWEAAGENVEVNAFVTYAVGA